MIERRRSDGAHARRLETLGALVHIELDLLALLEGAITVHLDGAEVHEYVGAFGLRDEAVALLGVEPLHCTGRHGGDPPSLARLTRGHCEPCDLCVVGIATPSRGTLSGSGPVVIAGSRYLRARPRPPIPGRSARREGRRRWQNPVFVAPRRVARPGPPTARPRRRPPCPTPGPARRPARPRWRHDHAPGRTPRHRQRRSPGAQARTPTPWRSVCPGRRP